MEKDKWKDKLKPEQHHVLREKGTEPAFSGKFLYNKKKGIYTCAACKSKLFSSMAKYDSGSGWPSFYEAIDDKSIVTKEDNSHFMKRIEIMCAKCGSHLGHLFPDGPRPTGQRYCVNSLAMEFKEEGKA